MTEMGSTIQFDVNLCRVPGRKIKCLSTGNIKMSTNKHKFITYIKVTPFQYNKVAASRSTLGPGKNTWKNTSFNQIRTANVAQPPSANKKLPKDY